MAVKPEEFVPLIMQADEKLVAALIERVDAALTNPLADVVRIEDHAAKTVRIAVPTGLTQRDLSKREVSKIVETYLAAGWAEVKVTSFEQRIAVTLKLNASAAVRWDQAVMRDKP